jgi:chemotaxis protein MotB
MLRLLAASAIVVLSSACAELDYLQAKTIVQEQRINELEASLEQWQDSYNKLRNQAIEDNEKFLKERKQHLDEISRLRNRKTDRERELANSERELKLRLQEQLDTNDELRQAIDQQAKNFKSRIADQAKEIEKLSAAVKKAETDLATARSAAESANRALTTANARIKKLEGEVAGLEGKIDAHDDQLKEKDQTIAALRKKMESASASEGTLSEQLRELEKQLAAKDAEIARLKNQLAGQAGGPRRDPKLEQAKKQFTEALGSEIKQKNAQVLGGAEAVVVRIQSDTLFDPATVLLRDSAQALLRRIAEVLKRYPDYQLRIEGHTDNVPVRNMPFPDNLALSSQRADNVLRFLLDSGELPVGDMQIRSSGCSYWLPIAPNDTPEGRKRNRRVDIVLLPKD